MSSALLRSPVWLSAVFLVIASVYAHGQLSERSSPHPLEIHMKHWISGSGQWRSPNPDYVPAAEPRTLGWIEEFGVNWKWGPNQHHMMGEIVAISAEGDTVISATMYAFYNPVTERVVQVQIARNGIYSIAEDPARKEPTPYGNPEVSDSLEFWRTGEMKILRHSNVFVNADTQLSETYTRDEQGRWQLGRQ